MFDLARLDAGNCSVVAAHVKDEFAGHAGLDWTGLPAKAAIRRVARKLASGLKISILDAARLYLTTRGLKACVERFV